MYNFTEFELGHLKKLNIFPFHLDDDLNNFLSFKKGIKLSGTGKTNKYSICNCGLLLISDYSKMIIHDSCPLCKNSIFESMIMNIKNELFTKEIRDDIVFDVNNKMQIIYGTELYWNFSVDIDNKSVTIIKSDKIKEYEFHISKETIKDSFVKDKKKKIALLKFLKSSRFTTNNIFTFLALYNEIVKKTDLYIPTIEFSTKKTILEMMSSKFIKLMNEFFQFDTNYFLYDDYNAKHNTFKEPKNIFECIDLPKSILIKIQKYILNYKNKDLRKSETEFLLQLALNLKNYLSPEQIIDTLILYKENNSMDKNIDGKIIYLLNDHNYSQLSQYFKREKVNQHIYMHLMVNNYYDYVRMSKEMNIPYTKYPKNLIKVHNIRQKDYKVMLDEKQHELFLNNYELFNKEISFLEIDNYIFSYPKIINDLIKEGQVLNHCVASYANLVAKGESIIYFMRNKIDENKPLITIEIKPLTKQIVQVRGNHNRLPTNKEQEVLKKWARKNSLRY